MVILKILLWVLICILTGIPLFSQQPNEVQEKNNQENTVMPDVAIKKLKIGDKVPDIEFAKLLNYNQRNAKLSDFKNKWVLLDFWATNCTACLQGFPKMAELQKKFNTKIQVLLVNTTKSDSEKKLLDFFAKRKNKPGFGLPTVIEDSTLSRFFPHETIPHCVWISPDRILRAITFGMDVTAENINRMMADEDFRLPVKIDVYSEHPLFFSDELPVDRLNQYSIFLKGKIEGLVETSGKLHRGNGITGIMYGNKPVLYMYHCAAEELMNKYGYGFNEKKLVLEINDSSLLYPEKSRLTRDAWAKENLCTYDMIMPDTEIGKLHEYVLQDLNRSSGYIGSIEKRKIPCLILRRSATIDKLQSAGGKPEYKLYDSTNPFMKNMPLSKLVAWLNRQKSIPVLIIDETNYTGNADIKFGTGLKSFSDFRNMLKQYELELVETERETEVFVLREKKKEEATAKLKEE